MPSREFARESTLRRCMISLAGKALPQRTVQYTRISNEPGYDRVAILVPSFPCRRFPPRLRKMDPGQSCVHQTHDEPDTSRDWLDNRIPANTSTVLFRFRMATRRQENERLHNPHPPFPEGGKREVFRHAGSRSGNWTGPLSWRCLTSSQRLGAGRRDRRGV